MPAPAHNVELRPITREQWFDIVARHATDEAEPPIRRHDQRYSVEYGDVKLAFMSEDLGGLRTVVRTVALLQVSRDGLMVRSHANMPVDTALGMKVFLGEDSFALLGRVAHCTDTIGACKIGIQLAFIDGALAAQ